MKRSLLPECKLTPQTRSKQDIQNRSTSKSKTQQKPAIEPLALHSPKQLQNKCRSQNYFRNPKTKSEIDETLVFLRSPKPEELTSSRLQKNYSQIDLGDSTDLFDNVSVQLRLETQSRQVFQQQVKELKEKLVQSEEQITLLENELQNMKEQNYTSKNHQMDTQADTVQLKKKYEQLMHENEFLKDHIRIAQNINKQLELEKLQANKSGFIRIPNSPERRCRSPNNTLTLINQKNQLENQLQQTQQNKHNIEKALEIKLSEALDREQYLNERIHRLEAQLRAKQNYEREKQEQVLLEQKLKELNSTLDAFKKQIKQHNSQVFQIKNQHQKQVEKFETAITQLQTDKKQQEQEIRRLVATNTSLEQKINELTKLYNSAKEDNLSTIQQKVKMVHEIQQLNDSLKTKLTEKDRTITVLENQLSISEQNRLRIEETLDDRLTTINDQQKTISNLEEELKNQALKQKKVNTDEMLELTLQLRTLEIEKKSLQKQLQIAQATLPHNGWMEEFQIIKVQADDIDTAMTHIDDGDLEEKLNFLQEQNDAVREQLNVFETDMNQGLMQQIQQTSMYLRELNALITH